MHRPQQEFTFINVNEGKKLNTRTIKRHVSNQTNRRKRQEAVRQYQASLLDAAEQSSSSTDTLLSSPSHSGKDGSTSETTSTSRRGSEPSEVSSSSEHEDEYEEFNPHRELAIRTKQKAGYWPTYQNWALRHLKPQPSFKPANTRKSAKTWKVLYGSTGSRIVVLVSNQHITIHIPRINDPMEFSKIQWSLKTADNFIRSAYESTWKPVWQEKPWYQGSLLPLGIWRESFPLAVEFIQAGKVQQAFHILNAALSVTPAFFKEIHPGLLIAILGAMMYTCQISDYRLSTLIRSHVTQLTMAHLGAQHPISLLLREQMRYADATDGRVDLLAIAVIDTFLDVFGPDHFVPLSMRFGYVRRQLSSGDHDGALSALTSLEKVWNVENMPGVQLPKFVVFEKTKVLHVQQKFQETGVNPSKHYAEELDNIASESVELPIFIPGQGPALQPTDSAILNKLGKHLLFGSHYALALYIYSRIPEVFSSSPDLDSLPISNPDPETLPLTVARILVDHLKNEMEEHKKE